MQPVDRVFTRNNLLPQTDLQAENVFPQGQYILGPVGQVLAYVVGDSPSGPRKLQLDSQGRQVESLGYSKLINLVAPRTDTATVLIPNVVLPEFTSGIVFVRATAVSGTTPSLTLVIQTRDSQGVYSQSAGGISATAITAVGVAGAAFANAIGGITNMAGPVVQLNIAITGTTPSFTWYADFIYK